MDDQIPQTALEEYDENELVFGPDGKISRRKLLLAGGTALGAAASGPLLFTTADAALVDAGGLPYTAHTNVKGHILFWHFWSSPLRHGAIRAAIKQFNQHYKGVQVTDLPIPFGDIFDKLHAAVAAQKGMPDVMIADRPSFWVDARTHTYDPVTSLVKRDHVNGSVFLPFTWFESNVKVSGKNQTFGLPFETDIKNLYWNRAMFLDAGLNPNKAPATWSDLPHYADKLDQKGAVAAFWPLSSMGLLDWAWTNNTDAQNKKMYPMLNNSRMVQAGDFLKTWTARYGGVTGFRGTISSQNASGRDEFQSGHQAMTIATPTYQDFMTQQGIAFKPKSGKTIYPYWGMSYIPHASGGKPYSFSGGFALGTPRNSHRSSAQMEASWEFMKFMALVGQLTFERFVGNIPCVKSMLNDSFLTTKPHWSAVKAALKYGKPKDRNFYDAQFPDDVLGPAQDKITSGGDVKSTLNAAQSQALTNMKRNGGP